PRTRTRRRTPRRPALLAGVCVGSLALVLVAGAFAYDASTSGKIAAGVRIGPVAVGGLEPAAARRKVARAYRRLERPVTVRFADRRFVLAPREADVDVDVRGAVEGALDRSRDGWFLGRAVRSLAGGGVDTRIEPRVRYSGAAVEGFAYRVEAAVERPRRPAP